MVQQLTAAARAKLNTSSLQTSAAQQVQAASRTLVTSKARAVIDATPLERAATTSMALKRAAQEITNLVIERTTKASWSNFKHKSFNDCSYFGVYQYLDTPCTLEQQATLLFAFDVYAMAFGAVRNLLRQDPDTFGLAEVGVDYITHKDVLNQPCTVLRDPQRTALSQRLTWRGYARLQWVKTLTHFTSAAFWATNLRTGFLYGIGMGERAASRAGLPVGEPWVNSHGDELWAWGPDSVKEWTANLWLAATEAGKELFVPLPTQSFLASSQDPGLDQPWVWASEGRFVDTQTRAELKRGQRRRSTRRAERRGRDGFYATQGQFDAFGGGKVQMPKDVAARGTFATYARPEWSMPKDFELGLALSSRGEGLFAMRDITQTGERSWVMPSGDLLVRLARAWGEEVVNLDIADHMLRGNVIYVDYLKRFAEWTPLSKFTPEEIARYEAAGNVVETRGKKRGIMYVAAAGFTLRDLEQMSVDLAKAKAKKVAGYVNSAIPAGVAIALAVAAAVSGVPVAGWIASVIIIVLTALVTFFTWLFGGTLVGCPKAPRPMVLRSIGEGECNFDIAQSTQTIEQSWTNLESTGLKLGVRFTFPKSKPIEPPMELPGGADFQFPALPPPPPPAEVPVLPLLLGGAAALGLVYLALRR